MIIKGKKLKKKNTPVQQMPDMTETLDSMVKMVNDIRDLEVEVVELLDETKETVNNKLQEVDKAIIKAHEVYDVIQETKEEALNIIRDIKQGDPGKDADEEHVISEVIKRLPTPKEVDEEALITEAVSRVPKFDEKGFLKKVKGMISDRKTDLKVIRESIEIDPMSVIEKIMDLSNDDERIVKVRGKLTEGMEQTISAFRNQLGRGYLHGGGISNITGLISAGTNITITGTGTKTDPYVINSSGGGGGISSINADTTAAQLLVTGTAGTNFAIVDNGTGTHTFNLPTASATNTGKLSNTDWTTFNNKQPAGSYITALTGDVTATGPGSVAATIKNSVALAGSPTTTTQSAGDNSTKIATTAYVDTINRISFQFSIPLGFNPADATSYLIGSYPTLPVTTTGGSRYFVPPMACTLRAVSLVINVTGTLGSAENVTFAVRKNNTTDATVSSTVQLNIGTAFTVINSALNVSYNGTTDFFEIKMATPTWTTNPTGVLISGIAYFE